MSRSVKLVKGDLAEITFLDHCEDPEDDDALAFTIWGRVTEVAKTHYEITCWAYADGKRRADNNEKRFQILKSAITRTKKLK